MNDSRSPLDRLASLARPEGGWGYSPEQPAHLEPTCLALLALAAEPERFGSLIESGVRSLQQHAQPDGSYRLSRGRPAAVWPTALVLFTRQTLGHPDAELKPTIDRLLAVQGRVVKADPEIADMMDINVGLIGWPWAESTFSWVEPTAWAVLALRHAGQERHPRVLEGERLLLDRAFDTGGINYGNRIILGRMTEPIPGPTALMLLALQGCDQPRVAAARAYLRQHAASTTDLDHLAWAKLALSANADDNETRAFLPQLDARIRAAYESHNSPNAECGMGNAESKTDDQPEAPARALSSFRIPHSAFRTEISPSRLALVALALDAERRNPFRIDGAKPIGLVDLQTAPPVEAQPPTAPRRGLFERVRSGFRGMMVNGLGKLRQPPVSSAVHIAEVPDYDQDLAAVLKRQFESFRAHVPPMRGKRVVLKPNLVEYHRDKVINTNPRVVEAVIELCKAEGAGEVIVAEGPGHWRNVEFLVEESGLGEVLKRQGVRFVDLNHDEPVKTLNLGRLTGLEYLYLTRTVTTADVFVSLPKLKTHHWAGATLSLKNLFGTLPGSCYGWPKNELHWRGIPQSVIDIALTQTPHLAIVDGIVGMEGDGPLNGKARHLGALVMGVDLVAVDATCCRLIGLPPERVPTLVLGAEKRLGRLAEAQVEQLGEPIIKLAQSFELPPQVEKRLMPAAQPA